MRIHARLLRSLADREPGRSHKANDNKEDEEYRECRGHTSNTSARAQAGQPRMYDSNHVSVGIYY